MLRLTTNKFNPTSHWVNHIPEYQSPWILSPPNQYVELCWAVDDLTIRMDATSGTSFCPTTPSIMLTVTQAAI